MKIALLTIWHIGNYGAEMQAYATVKALNELGHEVCLIDLRLTDALHPTLKIKIAGQISMHSKWSSKLNSFWKEFMPGSIRYTSLEQLKSNPPQADIYLIGSDQVWNPVLTESLSKAYFLDFGSNETRRISYASSFGVSEFEDSPKFIEDYGPLLERLNCVSCREKTGVELLKRYFNIDAVNVLDPTLLHTDYCEITGKLSEEETLVFYPISSDVAQVEEMLRQLAIKLNLKYINANYKKMLFGSIKWDGLSVNEWLRTIGQAKFVMTPSFHGVAFSIIFHRQFIVVGTNAKRSSRIIDLLEVLGLSDRIYPSVDEALADKPWEKIIDYSQVDAKLSTLREASWEYLSNSLK
ncbi:MAG: polysaccharide pyruvyl transferase family protein [Bacteroidales bacterium]|nr:polysaccharide pyruvyl transferase family protein [Bacteroidales bacterium]